MQVADHTRDDSMEAIAAAILAQAPPRFALVGLSMGGYIALTMVRQAPARVHKLALLDTSARPETPEQSERRKPQIALAQGGHFAEVPPLQFPVFVHRNRQHDEALRARVRSMAEETGAEAFLRQQKAIMTRPDMRPLLASIGCPTLLLVGDGDELTPPPVGGDRRRHRQIAARRHRGLRTPLDHGAAGSSEPRARGMDGALIVMAGVPAAATRCYRSSWHRSSTSSAIRLSSRSPASIAAPVGCFSNSRARTRPARSRTGPRAR